MTAGLRDEMTTMDSYRLLFSALLTAALLYGQAVEAQDDDREDRGGRNSTCTATIGRDRVNGTLNVVGRCTLTGTDVRGDVVLFAGGSLIARGIRIRGSLAGDRADFVELHDVRVDRGVDLRELVGDSSTIEGSDIRGDTVLTGNRSRFEIVDNDLRDLTVRGNIGGLQIAGNSIDGDLSCSGNAPAPTLLGNRIDGETQGQCAPSRPTPTPTPSPTPVAPPPATSPPPSTPTTPKTPTPSPPPTSVPPPPAPPATTEPPTTTAPPATPAPPATAAPAPAADTTLLDDGGAGAFGWPMLALLLPLLAWRRGRRRCA